MFKHITCLVRKALTIIVMKISQSFTEGMFRLNEIDVDYIREKLEKKNRKRSIEYIIENNCTRQSETPNKTHYQITNNRVFPPLNYNRGLGILTHNRYVR